MAGAMRAVLQGQDGSSAFSLLVVDEDNWARQGYKAVAEKLGFAVITADSPGRALMQISSHPPDLVLIGPRQNPSDIVDFVSRIRRLNPAAEVITLAARCEPLPAPSFSQSAASNLYRPLEPEALAGLLSAAMERLRANHNNGFDQAQARLLPAVLVGQSATVQKLRSIVSKLGASRQPVLITGERGTGKEQLARAIHETSGRREPFYPLDCSARAADFLERELFSVRNSPGTVFLNHVNELPLELQSKLVRALRECDRAAGNSQTLPGFARLVAAATSDLETAVRHGAFRRDLYLRLNAVILRLSPLRDRKEDIPRLVYHLLDPISAQDRRPYSLAPQAMPLLVGYSWPGNLNELRECLQHAAAVSISSVLHPTDFTSYLQQRSAQLAQSSDGPAIIPLAEVEKQTILNALERLNGDKMVAARLLGIGKTTLYRKLREYGIAESWITRISPR
jgi:DNA-binding NtrC family response regulator